ncbi:structural constituent of ribosome [Ranunculus cassubicifolius]
MVRVSVLNDALKSTYCLMLTLGNFNMWMTMDVGVKDIEPWTARLLPSRQFGYFVLTTSAGIMHEEARRKNIGGKVIGSFTR